MCRGPLDKLEKLPKLPGVYLFKDQKGHIIYIGKARNLRNRVRSYFVPGRSDERFFIGLLDKVLGDIETVVTDSEKEALLLENTLIKEHQPRYNIKLRDDKDFLHLRIDLSASWPKLDLVRRPQKDSNQKSIKLFGPYTSARAARRTMLLASRYFRLRTCKDRAMYNRSRPCLLFQMKRCPGPCVYDIDRESYLEQVNYAMLFLTGRHKELIEKLRENMKEAARDMVYEKAAIYRDQIQAIEATLSDQHVVQLDSMDQDVFGLYREEGILQFLVLQMRQGKITGQKDFYWTGQDLQIPEEELFSSFLLQYYDHDVAIPDAILLPFEVETLQGLLELLSERRSKKVLILNPKRGHRAALVNLAQKNAREVAKQRTSSADEKEFLLLSIAKSLKLRKGPHTIECLDIAHHSTGEAVAAIAFLRDGEIDPSGAKNFTIKKAKTGDDYGGMYEVLSRRFQRAKNGEEAWTLPDLFVVDGGRGQLSVAEAALQDVGFTREDLSIVGLAKERASRMSLQGEVRKEATVERVYIPGRVNPITIGGSSPLLILCKARDEAHRRAGLLLNKKRKKSTLQSSLDQIEGIGPNLRKILLRELGSVKAVQEATLEKLETVSGIGKKRAQKIHAQLRRSKK